MVQYSTSIGVAATALIDDVQTIDAQWIAPALQALQARSLAELRLTAPNGPGVQRFDLVRGDLWKFWRSAPT